MRSRLLILIIFAACFTACSREEIPVQNNGITGNWQLTAILSGQAKTTTGWVPVSEGYAESLELLANGTFFKTITQHRSTAAITGFYTVTEGNLLVLTPQHNQPSEAFMISEKTGETLILEKPVKNGAVKMSYARR